MPTINIPQSKIVETLHQYAEEYSVETWPVKHREHLGISVIGDECWRKLWFGFRWVKLEQFEGRIRRLFQRGHWEEPRFEEFLLWAGIRSQVIDPRTNKQYKLSSVNGHYGGSTDGIGVIAWANNLRIILEFKTHNDKLFTKLKNEKLKLAHPKHYAQMSGYGFGFEVEHGLYCGVNKDTDEWYFEFLELDWRYGMELEKKAAEIIYSSVPPARISEQPSYWKCKFCSHKDICHNGAQPEKNCRSCEFAKVAPDGRWGCNKHNDLIPNDFIPKGCNDWKGIV